MPMRLVTCSSALVLVLVAEGVLGLAAPAAAQTAQVRYERAMAREDAVRDQAEPSPGTLRSIATAYEGIVRRYPRSGYCDNALWQAAGLLQLAWERGGQARDRDKAIALLEWLRREYPSSSLIRRIDGRMAELKGARGTAPQNAASTPPAATRTAEARPPAPAAPTPVRKAAPAEPVTVRGMSHTILPRGERLTFELSGETTFDAAAGTGDDLALLLSHTEAAEAIVDAARRIRGHVIDGVRLENGDDGLRVVVSVNGQPRQSGFTLYGPDRIAFDFETIGADAAIASSPAPAPAAAAEREPPASVPATPAAATSRDARAGGVAAAVPAAAEVAAPEAPSVPVVPIEPPSTISGSYSLARQLGLGVSRIVIDPGHGGSDPGAQANGVTEAAVVLDIALRLEKLLKAQPGFEVVLTRRTNVAVPLERRTEIANQEQADLFLSIHANSSPRRQTAGVETYFLNLATDREAEAVAARENASSDQSMHTLPQLVRAITNNNKIAESRELATSVQASLVRRLKGRNEQFKDLGVKQAPFVVLIGAQMPSVLAEVAFLTNRAEAGLIRQGAYRQQVAQALCDAILRYSASLKKVATVTASAEGR